MDLVLFIVEGHQSVQNAAVAAGELRPFVCLVKAVVTQQTVAPAQVLPVHDGMILQAQEAAAPIKGGTALAIRVHEANLRVRQHRQGKGSALPHGLQLHLGGNRGGLRVQAYQTAAPDLGVVVPPGQQHRGSVPVPAETGNAFLRQDRQAVDGRQSRGADRLGRLRRRDLGGGLQGFRGRDRGRRPSAAGGQQNADQQQDTDENQRPYLSHSGFHELLQDRALFQRTDFFQKRFFQLMKFLQHEAPP